MRDEITFILKLMLFIVLASAFAFLLLGCGTPPKRVYRYDATFWYEINGKRYECRDYGYGESK